MTWRHRLLHWCVCALALASCSAEPTASTPTGALQLFLDAMERSSSDETALEEAYRLLDRGAKAELGKRASLATSLSQRTFEPWEMLPQGRFRLRFRPRRMRVIDGPGDGKATVVVTGAADVSACGRRDVVGGRGLAGRARHSARPRSGRGRWARRLGSDPSGSDPRVSHGPQTRSNRPAAPMPPPIHIVTIA